jgi:ADP-ribosyl-[dinitrogen reductase] hydrolase
MIGALVGDIVGSIYEFHNHRSTDFPFWGKGCRFTDDSAMSVAVADWILRGAGADIADTLRKWGQAYPRRGYGGHFRRWIWSKNPQPYNSWGNGSAMRVSACGFAAKTLDEALGLAKRSAEVTHNHPEGIKGAQATAAAIFLARTGSDKAAIKAEIAKRFGYDLTRTCDEIRPGYVFNESCQDTVPEAVTAFLESSDYENAIRLAISLGGDSDTLACITGGMAEAFYGLPVEIRDKALTYFDEPARKVIEAFEAKFPSREPTAGNS